MSPLDKQNLMNVHSYLGTTTASKALVIGAPIGSNPGTKKDLSVKSKRGLYKAK